MDAGMNSLGYGVFIAFSGTVAFAGFLYFRQKGNTVAEAGTYGLMVHLMLQSWLSQVLLMIGWQRWIFNFQTIFIAAALSVIITHRRQIINEVLHILSFMRAHWLAIGALLAGWTYLAVAWCWNDPHRASAVLTTLVLPLNESIFSYARNTPAFALIALNHVVFAGPWQPGAAVGLVNLSAYMVIGFSTYALARRYAWPPMAVTVTLLVISMPHLVHHSPVSNSELLPAAAAVCAILALYRTVESPQARDVAMLSGAIGFSVYGSQLCYVLPAVLTGLSLMVLGRRHEVKLWLRTLTRYPGPFIVAAGMILVFSQIAMVATNIAMGRAWIGNLASDMVEFNQDGLAGTGANMVRYLLLSVHLPEWSDRICQWSFGFSGPACLKQFYLWSVGTLADGKGAAATFDISWASGNPYGWFGPVGFLLVIPALAYALWRGPYRLKTTALAMVVYWSLLALIIAWQPANVHLMTVFFVCSGFIMAFFLPPWRIGRNGCLVLQLLGILVAVSAMIH